MDPSEPPDTCKLLENVDFEELKRNINYVAKNLEMVNKHNEINKHLEEFLLSQDSGIAKLFITLDTTQKTLKNIEKRKNKLENAEKTNWKF